MNYNNIVKEEFISSKNGSIKYSVITDNAAVHNENDLMKKDPGRGFTRGRTMQHIGRVPCDVWHAHCLKVGYYQMGNDDRKKEMIKFLNTFKGWSPVENIRSQQANETSIIVK